MSLIADPDYVIHSLRLAYLRRIDDTAGPRVLTLPTITHLSSSPPTHSGPSSDSLPGAGRSSIDVLESSAPITRGGSNGADGGRFASDSHVVIAGLTDARLNPELRALHSPRLRAPSPTSASAAPWSGKAVPPLPQPAVGAAGSADTARAGGALRYTHTIYGPGRTGAVGMRVSGRRAPSMDEPNAAAAGASSRVKRRSSAMGRSGGAGGGGETEEPLRAALARRSSARLGSNSADAKSSQGAGEEGAITPEVPALAVQAATGDARAAAPLTAAAASSPSLLASSSSGSPRLLASSPRPVDGAGTPSSSSTGAGVQRSASITAPPRPPKRIYPAGRWRSASEGADGAPTVSLSEAQPEEEEEEAEEMQSPLGSESVIIDEASLTGPGMHRTDSESTVFSLAFIPPVRGQPRRSDSGTDSTPLSNRHMFTPVTELEEPAFPFPGAKLNVATRPAYPRSDSDSSMANRPLAPNGPSASEFDSSIDSRAPPSVSSPGGSIEAPSALQPDSLSPMGDSDPAGSASLPNTSASARVTGAPIASALGLETDAELVPVSAPSSSTAAVAAVATDLHDPTRQARGRVGALQLAPDGQRRLYPSRSRSQLPGSTTTHGASNEWFASLKSTPQTVAARHAARPTVSALSAQLNAQSSGPSNPFTQLYAGVGARSGAASVSVTVFFPFAAQQAKRAGKPASDALQLDGTARSMKVCVRKDATLEEVVGYALHCYVEEDWVPRLADGYEEEDDAALDVRLSTAGWTLRIVEDGEVDDDYPAIDRSLIVGKFGADELAVVEATPAQVKQHLAAQTPAQRTNARSGARAENSTTAPLPSANLKPGAAVKTATAGAAARLQAAAINAPAGSLVSVQGTPIFASSALSRSAMGPSSTSIFLRVAVTPNAEVRYKTTLQVPSDMYLADVLETICRKRHLANADEWALIVPDKDIVVPLDRTVESLQGNHDLALVRRSSLGAQGGAGALTGQSTNPSASIFKRLSEPVQPRYNKAKDIASTYKSFTVNRKMPMFVGRHERTLTLDGDWIHIIPTDSRAFQTHAASFPVQSVTTCARSTKLAHNFKLIVNRETERDTKRYDFECATTTQAAEIVREINERMRR